MQSLETGSVLIDQLSWLKSCLAWVGYMQNLHDFFSFCLIVPGQSDGPTHVLRKGCGQNRPLPSGNAETLRSVLCDSIYLNREHYWRSLPWFNKNFYPAE